MDLQTVTLLLGIVGVAFSGAAIGQFIRRRLHRSRPSARVPECVRCGYLLEGAVTPCCPECGADLRVRGVIERYQRGRTMRALCLWIGGPVALTACVLCVLSGRFDRGRPGTVFMRSVWIVPRGPDRAVLRMMAHVMPEHQGPVPIAAGGSPGSAGGSAGDIRTFWLELDVGDRTSRVRRWCVSSRRAADQVPAIVDALWAEVPEAIAEDLEPLHAVDPEGRDRLLRTARAAVSAAMADMAAPRLKDFMNPLFRSTASTADEGWGAEWQLFPTVMARDARPPQRLYRPWMGWTALVFAVGGAVLVLLLTRPCRVGRGLSAAVPRTSDDGMTQGRKGDERESNPRPPEPQSGALTD